MAQERREVFATRDWGEELWTTKDESQSLAALIAERRSATHRLRLRYQGTFLPLDSLFSIDLFAPLFLRDIPAKREALPPRSTSVLLFYSQVDGVRLDFPLASLGPPRFCLHQRRPPLLPADLGKELRRVESTDGRPVVALVGRGAVDVLGGRPAEVRDGRSLV